MKRVVSITMLSSYSEVGGPVHFDLGYARYSVATWKHWCRKHGVELEIFAEPLEPSLHPTFQQWLTPARAIEKYGRDTEVCIVDPDTMIRWDAPDLFAAVGPYWAAVERAAPRRAMRAYCPLFPGASLPHYLDSGVVVVNGRHLPMLEAFIDFSRARWPELLAIQRAGLFGTDQVPLSFFLAEWGTPIQFLSEAWNRPAPVAIRKGNPDFFERSYVSHFCGTSNREALMAETWDRVRSRYSESGISGKAA